MRWVTSDSFIPQFLGLVPTNESILSYSEVFNQQHVPKMLGCDPMIATTQVGHKCCDADSDYLPKRQKKNLQKGTQRAASFTKQLISKHNHKFLGLLTLTFTHPNGTFLNPNIKLNHLKAART